MEFIKKYRHLLWVVIYGIIYLGCFQYLEEHVRFRYQILHTEIDDVIPFCEYFIIPYLTWFAYIFIAIVWFGVFENNRKEYYQMILNLGIGMTLFLLISWLWPNGQNLRPRVLAGDSICIRLVRMIYQADSPTNIFPSIHVFNSLAINAAVQKSETLKRYRSVQKGSCILTILICLSTLFLKQHSVIDATAGLLLNSVTCAIIYNSQSLVPAMAEKRRKRVLHM